MAEVQFNDVYIDEKDMSEPTFLQKSIFGKVFIYILFIRNMSANLIMDF